ncbi:MAG TPA: response regulator [Actinomycetota bacterium]|nr:response regulator [Actinomycetota bacterium]
MSVKVLVVDDTDHVRNMLVEMLELDGFNVVGKADSGQMAIGLASEADPDVVVMDYKMPKMDGLTAARTIKDERPGQAIILYTAYMDPDLEARAKQSGIALCVGKVEGLNQLERHISELCRDLA